MKKIFLVIILFLLLSPGIIKATPCPNSQNAIVQCGYNSSCPCDFGDLLNMIPVVVNDILYWLVLPGAALFLTIGGIMLLISGGNPNLAGLGKKILLATVIGLVLAFGAWVIVNFVLTTIGAPGLK